MKSLLARYQEKLAERERNEIWQRTRGPREPGAAPRWPRLAPAAGLAFAALAVTFLVRLPRPVPIVPAVPPGGTEAIPASSAEEEASSPVPGQTGASPGRMSGAGSPGRPAGALSGLEAAGPEASPPGSFPVAPRRAPSSVPARPRAPSDEPSALGALESGAVVPKGERPARGGRGRPAEHSVALDRPSSTQPDEGLVAMELVPAPVPIVMAPPPAGRYGGAKERSVVPPSFFPGRVRSAPARWRRGVPVIPYTGGEALPNDEPYDAMFFEHYGVNPFIPTDEDALSTFAVDVDNASYTVMRRYVELGNLPPRDAVRVEEYVNFFAQGYPRFEEPDFRLFVDGAPSPFGPGYQLLRVGIRGRVIEERDRKPATLVFVIDTSGSMAREDRLELVKRALGVLVGRLRAGDEVGIVVYGSRGRVILDPVRIGEEEHGEDRPRDREPDEGSWERRGRGEDELRPVDVRSDESFVDRYGDRGPRARILRAIESLHPDGSTNAEEGLRLGYEMARTVYRPGAINRIILCSDGVANVGRTGPESILEEVRSSADRGITLTTVGFGMGNYNDVLMEQLADRGDGNYYYVDDLEEARRVFLENLTGTLQVIGKDAKVQVEFDPKRVLRYRLLGFENRDVADRDFRNDQVDAGEIGAGHEVTALYEVKLAEGVERGTIATVRFRYARPDRMPPRRFADEEGEESEERGESGESLVSGALESGRSRAASEIEKAFDAADLHRRFEQAAPEFRLDAAVAEFAEILRKSYWAKESRIEDVLPVAQAAAEDLGTGEAEEFVRIVRKAEGLSDDVEPGDER